MKQKINFILKFLIKFYLFQHPALFISMIFFKSTQLRLFSIEQENIPKNFFPKRLLIRFVWNLFYNGWPLYFQFLKTENRPLSTAQTIKLRNGGKENRIKMYTLLFTGTPLDPDTQYVCWCFHGINTVDSLFWSPPSTSTRKCRTSQF